MADEEVPKWVANTPPLLIDITDSNIDASVTTRIVFVYPCLVLSVLRSSTTMINHGRTLIRM